MQRVAPEDSEIEGGHAYLLLSVQPGESSTVARQLAQLNPSAVPYAAAVWGQWDVVARVKLGSLKELLVFVDLLRKQTQGKIIRTETWWIRPDQQQPDPIGQPDRLAFVMLRVDPGQGKLKDVLDYVCAPSTRSEGAQVWHAAGVLGPYDIATTISYSDDVALMSLVMSRFQASGKLVGITDTLTISTIAGMVYPDELNRSNHRPLFRDIVSGFGTDFVAKFPAAAWEVEAASKCYAHGLATGCVFHLMRAVEVAVKAIAAYLITAAPAKSAKQNWGDILADINRELERRRKEKSPNWERSEDFFESVYVALSAIKTAWRNPTMHLENRYTDEQASDIFITVRSLMKTLASRLDESGELKV